MAENEQANVKFGIDVEDLNKGINRINKALSETDEGVKNLNKGFMRIKSKGTASVEQTTKVIENMTQRMKEMSLQLKNIQNQYAGSFKALERQAALRGTKTGSLSDNKIWAAQIEKLNVQNKTLVDTYSNVARKIDLVNVKMKELTGSYARQRAEIAKFQNQVLFGTNEGKDALKWRNERLKRENIRSDAFKESLASKGISTTTIQDASQIESLDRRLGAIQLKLMANYKAINMVTGAFRYLLNYTVEYDKELHQLQAIAAVSDTTMNQLKNSIQAVASSTKFTSLEVAQAGTVLAQAGLSAKQIETTLPAIAKLATATGTDLATSTDVITSTLNIYSLQASEAEHVTNALTTAMNESKADIGGFQKAIQYAGNYAAQLGVTYEETAAVISAATQAGIRSRSMLGTGLRAVLAEFLNPTKKLTAQLEKVGLTVEDIDVKSKGLTNVLKTLKESGFGATEAFRGMERRGAAFLASIINQTEFIDTLRAHMVSSTAATEADEIQMRSLGNQIKNFQNIMGTAAYEGLAPFEKILAKILKTINEFLGGNSIGKLGTFLGTLGTALTGAVSIYGSLSVIRMLGSALGNLGKQIIKLGSVAKAGGVVPVFKSLISKGNILIAVSGGLLSGFSYLSEKFGWFTSEADKAIASLEKQKGAYEEAKEKGDSVAAMLQRLYEQQGRLQEQSERDIFLQEILTRFPEAAQFVNKLTLSFSELEEVLLRLNNLTVGKAAEEASKTAEEALKTNTALAKEIGRESFYRTGEQLAFGEKNPYSTLINKMRSSGFYKNIDLSNADSLDFDIFPALFKSSGVAEYRGEQLYKTLSSSYNKDMSIPELVKVMADLNNAARKINDETLDKVTKLVTDDISNLIDDISKNNKAVISDLGTKYIEDITTRGKDYRDYETKLADDVKRVNEDLKNSLSGKTDLLIDSIKEWLSEYKEESDKFKEMNYLRDEEGNRRNLSTYSTEEFARFVGIDTSNEQVMRSLQKDLEDITKKYPEDIEERRKAFAEELHRTEQVNAIIHKMDLLENAIKRTKYGESEFEKTSGIVYRKAVDEAYKNLYKSRSVKQANDQAANVKLNAVGLYGASIANMLADTNTGQFREKLLEQGTINLKSVSNAYKSVYGKDIETEKNIGGIKNEISKFNQEMRNLDKDLISVTGTLNKVNPQISQTQTGMDSFFHRLNTDIKEIDMAYTNATRSMDQMLAKQQGVITGLERAYGSGSAVVKAEQIRLRKLEESQLGDRTAALEAKLFGYTKQLGILRGNPEYQKAKASYDEAFAKWNNAYTTGADQKTLLLAYKNLQDISKGWDKLATKEESLTSKIADLEDEIQKNTTAINKETEAKKYDREHPLGSFYSGIGDVATSYADQIDQEGLTSFRGMGGYLAEGSINGMNNAFVELFDNITKGSKSASESFKQFGRSIIQTMADVAKEMLAKQAVAAIFSYFMPDFSSGSSGPTNIIPAGYGKSAQGGLVTGPVKNRDSVPTMLMPGEYVLKKSAVDSLGRDYLDSLNNKSSSYMSDYSSEVTEAKSETTKAGTKSGNGVVNVYVVGQEQQKQMTPQDVVVTITQDMMTGGQTKKLVKSIAMGAI